MEFGTDHKFLEKLRQKESIACRQLYMQYADAMYNVCLRLVEHPEEAEDALQEAFIKIFNNIDQFRNESTIGAWIKQIVTNTCLNALRKKKNFTVDELNEHIEIVEPEDEQENDYDFSIEEIKKAIELLPQGYKVIFNLFMFENYTHKQIAVMLEISESTTKSQLFKAKKKLKELLLKKKR